jgi:hypothetical protein
VVSISTVASEEQAMFEATKTFSAVAVDDLARVRKLHSETP